jgi:hypothetical protein
MLVIDDLLFLPYRGFKGLFMKIAEAAEAEFTDAGKIKDDLMYAQMMYETDQISLPEYEKQEKLLLKRLDDIRIYQEEQKTD